MIECADTFHDIACTVCLVPGEFGSTTSLVQFAQNGIPEVTVTLEVSAPSLCNGS